MLKRKARTDKVIVLGVDGLDPRLTRKYVDMGVMPNVKKYIEAGSCRHDLALLGSHPTITPPQWTTLACGCHAYSHGINSYYRVGKEIGTHAYNLDSQLCEAEQVWNCFAEAGKKTLVFHWPGSAWPPSSDSENLMVVDGATPGPCNMGTAKVDSDFLLQASSKISEPRYLKGMASEAAIICVMEDIDVPDGENLFDLTDFLALDKADSHIIWKEEQFAGNMTEDKPDLVQSPLKEAKDWAVAPEGAKEFTLLLSHGFIRRVGLLLKNEVGVYDKVAIYKSKKDLEPMVVCPLGEYVVEVVDEAIKGDKKYERVNRNYKLLNVAENGEGFTMFVTDGFDMTNDTVWHPKRLFKEVTENVGYPVPGCSYGCQNDTLITDCMLDGWTKVADWHAAAILHLIESEKLDAVFSHFHNVDLQIHRFIKHLADKPFNRQSTEHAQKWMEDVYKQTDYYLGKFLHLLDEGWSIIITSDHAQVAPKYDVPMLQDAGGECTVIMEELGYVVLKKDTDGNRIGEIDWTQTRAIMQNEGHIYINLRGRNYHTMPDGTIIEGIVDPADKYELEEQIMTDLYNYKSKQTGKRIVALALRNKDCVHLGQGGPHAGDIYVWNAEGYNIDHGDSLSTTYGEGDTSMSPIFIAAGKGIKKGFETNRVIRQIDVAPTCCILGGVRMPRECEGAPAYQIFEEEV